MITASGLNCSLTKLERIPVEPQDVERMQLKVLFGVGYYKESLNQQKQLLRSNCSFCCRGSWRQNRVFRSVIGLSNLGNSFRTKLPQKLSGAGEFMAWEEWV